MSKEVESVLLLSPESFFYTSNLCFCLSKECVCFWAEDTDTEVRWSYGDVSWDMGVMRQTGDGRQVWGHPEAHKEETGSRLGEVLRRNSQKGSIHIAVDETPDLDRVALNSRNHHVGRVCSPARCTIPQNWSISTSKVVPQLKMFNYSAPVRMSEALYNKRDISTPQRWRCWHTTCSKPHADSKIESSLAEHIPLISRVSGSVGAIIAHTQSFQRLRKRWVHSLIINIHCISA